MISVALSPGTPSGGDFSGGVFALRQDNAPVTRTDYQPQFRRPIAGVFRRTASLAVDRCVRWGIHPDAISYGSIVVSLVAAACFWQSSRWTILLLLAPLLCYL